MAAHSLAKTLIISSIQTPNINRSSLNTVTSMSPTARTTTTTSKTTLAPRQRRSISAFEARISLIFALASQASSVSQRLLMGLASETAKYMLPKRFESRNFEEALMAVPDLETVRFKVLSRTDKYEIREVEPYFIAETTMPDKTGFDFNGASQFINVLAEYLFGKNTSKEKMEMTTPVITSRTGSDGERMDMTTPVITKKVENEDKWKMSFVMPSKYGSDLPLPKDSSVKIREVPRKVVAVVAFSEEQSNSDAEKLIADMRSLVYNHVRQQKELVDARLVDIRESAVTNKIFLDGHVSSMEGTITDAKQKWQAFSMQAENHAKDSADYSAAKHCRMEALLQQCVSTAESMFKHSKHTQESVNVMGGKHISDMASLIRNASDTNDQHDAEIDSTRAAVEQDDLKNTDETLAYIDSISEQELGITSGILDYVKTNAKSLETFQDDHSSQATSIKQTAEETFQQRYIDYDPSGTTPVRSEQDVPSKGTVESLRAMPMEALVEEFRENNSYESFEPKELKPSLIQRSPLSQIN